MKKKECLIFILLASLTVQAQDAMKILDTTANKIKKSGDVEVTFVASMFNATESQETIEGTMLLQGAKYYLDTKKVKTWYDGNTQWSYLIENNEVNITNPSVQEMQAIHPYAFLELYKQDYKRKVKETTLRNEKVFEVHLVGEKKNMDIPEIYLDIRKSDFTVLCVRIRQGDDWNRLSILSFKGGLKLKPEDFTFSKNEYPSAEIIDLR